MSVDVRHIAADDIDDLHRINEANVPEVGSVDRERFQFLLGESVLALVVTVDGERAGFCLVLPLGAPYDSVNYRWFSERYDDVWYLDRVAFDERFQRQGLGTRLYDEVERRIDARPDIAGLTLEVNVDPPNEPSLAFHRSRGYDEVGQQDTPYGIAVAMMRKQLSAGPA